MTNGRILISLAHPNDGSIGEGAAIAKWVDEGNDVYLSCATNGDAESLPNNMKDQYHSITELRDSELEHSSEILHLKAVFKLGYREYKAYKKTQHPDSLVNQWQRDPDRVIYDIVKVIRQVRPHIVITFNKFGGFGHPDHIATQQATVKAFKYASDPSYYVDGLPPYQPQKLYSVVYPKKLAAWLQVLRARLTKQSQISNLLQIYNHVEPSHIKFSVVDYFDVWDKAIKCHISQFGGHISKKYTWSRYLMYRNQELTRVYPPPAGDGLNEDHVFTGVTLD